jgi:fatty acid desaturase
MTHQAPNPQAVLWQRFLIIATAWPLLLFLCAHAAVSPLYAVITIVITPFLGLFCYAQMHEHYHTGFALFRKKHDWLGVLYASLLGFDWSLYRVHHGNHHRYSNGKGDFGRTIDADGQPMVGWRYVFRNAIKPFALQLVPYLIVFLTRPDKRTRLLWIDETARVVTRLAVFLVWGWQAFALFLVWQLVFMNYLFFFNYLQHFHVNDGEGVVWEAPFLNKVFLNGGLHDQHHANPAWRADELPLHPARVAVREKVGLFNPIAFCIFLVSPHWLAKFLGVETGAPMAAGLDFSS